MDRVARGSNPSGPSGTIWLPRWRPSVSTSLRRVMLSRQPVLSRLCPAGVRMIENPNSDVVRKLRELSRNLWWSWQPEIRAIFRELSPEIWSAVYHTPVALLERLDGDEIARRVHDLEMQTRINQAHRRLTEYVGDGEGWGLIHAGPLLARPVAYFSAEFGLHHSIPIYSGGLGVLAGDHLKSMSDLGVPVVGVGLLYHPGYVHH